MDEIVLRAMKKWPDVPRVYGWLQLDRRGQWLVKGPSGAFERIGNPAICEFIGRNYACDGKGRWFFQNGPQRVFVLLDYTPWVYRLNEAGDGLVTHTAHAVAGTEALFLDEHGSLLAVSELGAGLMLDRDLPAVLARLRAENASLADDEALLEIASGARPGRLQLFGRAVTLGSVRALEVAARFGFVSRPAPAPGEPEC
jgi:hypothetical protein